MPLLQKNIGANELSGWKTTGSGLSMTLKSKTIKHRTQIDRGFNSNGFGIILYRPIRGFAALARPANASSTATQTSFPMMRPSASGHLGSL